MPDLCEFLVRLQIHIYPCPHLTTKFKNAKQPRLLPFDRLSALTRMKRVPHYLFHIISTNSEVTIGRSICKMLRLILLVFLIC